MTAVIVLLAIAVAVLGFLVAGLLRSHAVILRRLHELGLGVDSVLDAGPTRTTTPPDLGLPQPRTVAAGRPANDISGPGPRGESHALRVTGASDTILVFLSSGCTTCHVFWDELRSVQLPRGVRLVIVTKGEESESRTAVAELAPPGVTVVMSSAAWTDYEVPGSPYVIDVDGRSGTVRGEGTGPSWEQVRKMLLQGLDDLEGLRTDKAAADAQREREADSVLLAAGIEPGDPSLYQRFGEAPESRG